MLIILKSTYSASFSDFLKHSFYARTTLANGDLLVNFVGICSSVRPSGVNFPEWAASRPFALKSNNNRPFFVFMAVSGTDRDDMDRRPEGARD